MSATPLPPICWVLGSKKYDASDDLCPACADAVAADDGCRRAGGYEVARESDSLATCSRCGCRLACTVDGIEIYTKEQWEEQARKEGAR